MNTRFLDSLQLYQLYPAAVPAVETTTKKESLYHFIQPVVDWVAQRYRRLPYLCGLGEGVLGAFGDGAQVSTVDYGQNGHRRNNQKHKAR